MLKDQVYKWKMHALSKTVAFFLCLCVCAKKWLKIDKLLMFCFMNENAGYYIL